MHRHATLSPATVATATSPAISAASASEHFEAARRDSALDHCIARYESCSIAREVSGEYLVRHAAFPGQRWAAANLPTAHARCAELITRQQSG